ncbi:MAG: hypothetical protein H0V17_09325 [Deltaproteobacteria bacterium]|nr:hypothetical protein [Deltaproteobacteria bacterium]
MRLTLAIATILATAPTVRADTPTTVTGEVAVGDGREYAEKYVREVGMSTGFVVARNLHSITVTPSFGWFITDKLQVSALVSLTSIKAGSDQSTIVTTMIEPSYHQRLDQRTFAFAGMGFGYSYIHRLGNGLTYTIRTGLQFLIAKTHLFIPSVSYDFRTNEPEMPTLTEIAAERALRFNLGYAKLW